MTRSDFDEDTEPLIKELGWKTVGELVRYYTVIMMYRSMHNIAPTYLSNIFQPLKDVHQTEFMDTSSNLTCRLSHVTQNKYGSKELILAGCYGLEQTGS